jgi:hypothetical protein
MYRCGYSYFPRAYRWISIGENQAKLLFHPRRGSLVARAVVVPVVLIRSRGDEDYDVYPGGLVAAIETEFAHKLNDADGTYRGEMY